MASDLQARCNFREWRACELRNLKNFYLLGSTNLLTPLANWTRLLTNQFDPGGNFDFTNPLPPNTPSEFYRLQVP